MNAGLLENVFLCADLQIFGMNGDDRSFAGGRIMVFGMGPVCTDKNKTVMF